MSEFEGLLSAGRTRSVVRHFKLQLAAEHAASGVDLVDGELRLLHDRGRDNAVGAGQPYRHADDDRPGIGGMCDRGEEQAYGARSKEFGCHSGVSLRQVMSG